MENIEESEIIYLTQNLDDKLIIKTYHAEKRRDFNRKYFKKYWIF